MQTRIIFVGLLWLGCTLVASAQAPRSDINTVEIPVPKTFTFKVFEDTGVLAPKKALANAHIRIASLNKSFKVRTNDSGKAVVKHLPNGHYNIQISKKGCRTVRKKLKRTLSTNHMTTGLTCKGSSFNGQ